MAIYVRDKQGDLTALNIPAINGKSAYEVALSNGFEGTEQEWLESLKGEDGITPNISIGTVATLEAGQQATVIKRGTKEEPVFDFGIPKGRDFITTLTRLTIDDNILNLTKDQWQKVNMANNTTINLPQVNGFTEIHLFFRANSELTLILPNNVVWKNKPNIEANKVYEFVFTYIDDNEWIAGCITYNDSGVYL